MPIPLQFATEHNPGRYGHDGNALLVNAYAEPRSDGQKGLVWYACEGLTTVATLTYGGPCQGMTVVDNEAVIVGQRQIYTLTSLYDLAHVGAIPVDGPVTLAANRKTPDAQIGICAGGLLRVLEAGLVSAVTPNIANPISIDVVDGYGVVVNAAGQFGISDIDDLTSWDPLDIATANSHRDGLVRGIGRGSELILAGPDSLEFWANTGAATFPFEQIPGTSKDLGSRSPASWAHVPVQSDDTVLMFVASDNTVRALSGYTPTAVSTAEIERLIEATADKSAIRADVYLRPQHAFYVLTGPGWSRAYDARHGRWIARESYTLGRWRVQGIAKIGDVWLAGDYATGSVYRIDPDTYNEAGAPLVWSVTALASAYPDKIDAAALYLDTVPGQGRSSADEHAAVPEVMIEVSRDMGQTWSPPRHLETGRLGEHSRRVKTRRLGTSGEDGFLVRVSMSSETIRGLTGGGIEAVKVEA